MPYWRAGGSDRFAKSPACAGRAETARVTLSGAEGSSWEGESHVSLKSLLRSVLGSASVSRRKVVATSLVGSVLVVPLVAPPAQADDTLYIPWSTSLPGWTDEYVPSSENDCVAGRWTCLSATLKELAEIPTTTGRAARTTRSSPSPTCG